MLNTLRRLEDRGEVRGGRFVSDFLGEQFALPGGRGIAARHAPRTSPAKSRVAKVHEKVTLSAADPLNLAGIIVPGERVAANSGALVTFRDGAAMSAEPVPEIADPHTARSGRCTSNSIREVAA